LAAVGVVVALAGPAFAKAGVRVTPDGKAILVNKDVGGDRWAITLDPERASVSGNVFVAGADAQFVWCTITGSLGDPARDLENAVLITQCYGAGPCSDDQFCGGGLGSWQPLGEVRLPGSFFVP
jgi:hypothetical protein